MYIGIYLETGIYRGVEGSCIVVCAVFKLYDPVIRGFSSLPCRGRKVFFPPWCGLLSAGFWGGGFFWLLVKLWRLTGCCPSILVLFTELNSRKHSVLYLTTSGLNQLPDFGPGESFGSDWQGLFLFPSLPGIFSEEIPCCLRDVGNALISPLPMAR